MKFKLTILAAAIALLAAAPAWPASILFDFGECSTITSSFPGTCPGDLGITAATFSDSTNVLSITAFGYDSSTSTGNLFVKNDSTSEHGLGLTGTTTDNEINFGQYIYLDMGDLISHGISTAVVGFGSLQSGEFGQVCETTAVGTPGTLNCQTVVESDSTAIGSANVGFSTTDPVLAFTVPNSDEEDEGNFLILGSVSASPAITPEPGTFVLLGTALLAMGLVSKRLRWARA